MQQLLEELVSQKLQSDGSRRNASALEIRAAKAIARLLDMHNSNQALVFQMQKQLGVQVEDITSSNTVASPDSNVESRQSGTDSTENVTTEQKGPEVSSG